MREEAHYACADVIFFLMGRMPGLKKRKRITILIKSATVGLVSFRRTVQVLCAWYTSSFISFSSGFRALSSARSKLSRTQLLSGADIAAR
jgi:hypothetical protein